MSLGKWHKTNVLGYQLLKWDGGVGGGGGEEEGGQSSKRPMAHFAGTVCTDKNSLDSVNLTSNIWQCNKDVMDYLLPIYPCTNSPVHLQFHAFLQTAIPI